MKRWITSAVLAGGLVLTGCASEVTPATNDLNTISPIPETSASLVLMILASASALVHHVTGSSPSCSTITTGHTEWLSCD